MRKIVLMTSVSLDGYIAGPNGELDWHLVDDEVHNHFNDVLRAMSVFLFGRVMYEQMAEFWPTADSDPSSTNSRRPGPSATGSSSSDTSARTRRGSQPSSRPHETTRSG